MKISFAGKTAVVTGGASGIGFATAQLFAADGARVFLLDSDGERLAAAASEIGAACILTDVTSGESIASAFAATGPMDIVVINAGIAPTAPIDTTTEQMWRHLLDVNLTGAFLTLKAATAVMKPRRSGSMVLTASTNSYDGEATLIAYNASKAGILGVLHTAANELGPFGIRVNAVCPGLIRTRLTNPYFDHPETLKEYFRHIPMGRGGTAEEVAQAIAFLASDAASFIHGAALLVDGGQLACKYSTWNESNAHFRDGRWILR